MKRGGEAPHQWGPEEATRFFDAFHQHGQDWEKVAAAVGDGKSAADCEALQRKQQAYLSIPQSLQSAQAFAALVENAQKEELAAAAAAATGGGSAGEPSRSRSPGGGGGGEDAAAGSTAAVQAASGMKAEEGEEMEGAEGEAEEDDGMEGDDLEEGEDGRTLAANRTRRTPKHGAGFTSPPPGPKSSGRRTPLSGLKRSRGGPAGSGASGAAGRGGDDIYEYYDEGADAITESARKRRVARQRLDFQPQGAARRRHDADEAKGIDALLALAVAGEESAMGDYEEGDEDEGEEGQLAAPPRAKQPKAPRPAQQRRPRELAAEEEDEWEEEPADAGAVDDDMEDEDFAPPPRRTPYSTPAKGRMRPGSAHATPRRSGSRGAGGVAPSGLPIASPPGLVGLRGLSPYMGLHGGLDGDIGSALSDLGLPDLSYLTSPGFPQFPPGFVPSPENPMPRLRRRKSAPERMTAAPLVASPIKTLFTRRSSLAGGPSLLSSFGYTSGGGSGAAAGEEGGGAGSAAAGAPQSAAESELRRFLQGPRTQRWAAAEFVYSALDRPFFMFNPLSGLLAQLGLGEDARLSRREWSLVRRGLGKPRRLSLKFLKEERARLERWRDGCRQQYQAGAAAAAATDPKVADNLPRPLGVGQRVVARHPTSRQLHDGSVLTVAHNCYRVQFDRQELGVELVRDTDLMPCEPADNLPPALLGRARMVLNGRQVINGQPVRSLAPPRLPTAALPAAAMAAATPLVPGAAAGLLAGVKQEGAGAAAGGGLLLQQPMQQQQQARAAEAKALAELVVGLDKKEALLLQLRGMNDEAAAGMHTDASGAAAPQFVSAYANVVLQLKDVNEKVHDKLEQLERPGGGSSSSGDLGAGAAAAAAGGQQQPQQQRQQAGAGAAADDAAQQQQQVGQTVEAFSDAALSEAQAIMASCRSKLAESASEAAAAEAAAAAAAGTPVAAAGGSGGGGAEQQVAAAAAGIDWEGSEEGRQLAAVIQGCVHSLVLLQRGAASASASLPGATLSAALDGALLAVRPRSVANQALYAEIQEAMASLKLQISAT